MEKDPTKLENKFKHFKQDKWYRLNQRTVNGMYPNLMNKRLTAYFRKGIRLEITRTDWENFCDANRNKIIRLFELGEKPTVDRIDSEGHYALENMQILSLSENCKKTGFDKKAIAARRDKICKSIILIKPDGSEEHFDALVDAGFKYNLNPSHLSQIARGVNNRKTTFGFSAKFNVKASPKPTKPVSRPRGRKYKKRSKK